MAPVVPTHTHGRVLDWFLVARDLGGSCKIDVVMDTGIAGHTPVLLTVPSFSQLNFGSAIRKPHSIFPDPTHPWTHKSPSSEDVLTLCATEDVDTFWNRWNYLAEGWLMEASGAGPPSQGRGCKPQMVPNKVSAPQELSQGQAINEEIRDMQTRLSRLRRLDMYSNMHIRNSQQWQEWATLKARTATEPCTANSLADQIEARRRVLVTQRRAGWTQWCKEQWGTHPGRVYKYVEGQTSFGSMQKLHHDSHQPPPTVQDRMNIASTQWNSFWNQGQAAIAVPHAGLPPITTSDTTHVLNKINAKKALGADFWHVKELAALPQAFIEGLAAFSQLGRKARKVATTTGNSCRCPHS